MRAEAVRHLIACVLGSVLAVAASSAAAQGARNYRGDIPGEFDFYVLALSWSPAFCEREGDRKGKEQCEPGRRRGFVIHGLWPQFERGFPSDCDAFGRPPSRIALEEAAGVFPDQGLARYEWRKHGACSGKSPAEYFRDVRRARDRITIPDRFIAPATDQQVAPLDLERAFAAANPGLRTDMIALACRRGLLQEVRICLERDLRGFRTCPQVDRSGCRGGEVTIPAVR